mgnify:CR=1 FL=1
MGDFRLFLIDLLTKKGEKIMLAMLWANQIIMGKKTFSQVPVRLKEQVREILIDAGCEDLIDE